MTTSCAQQGGPDTDFLIQVALFGQNELHDRISRNHSLASRMTPARLNPFDPDGTRQMIEFRWQVAGGDKSPFDADGLAEIYRITSGNARDIVRLCDAALLRAFVDQRRVIDKDTVQAAASDAFVMEEGRRG